MLEVLKGDETLGPYLRSHIFEAVAHARSCLDRFEVTGAFDLARAIKDLEIFLSSAQAMTHTDSSAWKKLLQAIRNFTTNPTTPGIVNAITNSGTTALLTN